MNNSTTATGTAVSAANNIEKPKRPLSAFNLFYRYKRQHIIRLITSNAEGSVDKDTIRRLIKTPPGLEYNYTLVIASVAKSQAEINALRRHHICIELKNLQARDLKTRAHRKSMNCPIGFVELSKLMNSNWKECDDVAKAVFTELSEEIREVYRRQIKEYNDMCKALGITKPSSKKQPKKRSRISVDESDSISNESDNKKAKLIKKGEAPQPKFPPPLNALTSPPRVTPTPNNEVADHQEAANAMLMLGATSKKKQNGPLKKRQVHTSSLLNHSGKSMRTSSMVPTVHSGKRSMSSAFQLPPPPSKSGIVAPSSSVQLDDFTGSWKIPVPLRATLAQLNQTSQMTRLACAENGNVFSRSYESSFMLQQYMLREMERIQGSGRR